MKAPWYRFFKQDYSGADPLFFEKGAVSGKEKIENNFDVIENEMLEIIRSREDALKPYRFHDSSDGRVEWQTLPFFSWGYFFRKNAKLCPNSYKLLKSIPGVVSASLSLVEPHASVPLHRGDTNAIVRSHLGIMIPKGLPDCGFECGGEARGWEIGRLLSFCDAQLHTAWNNTDQRRFVMIIDEMRPEYFSQQNRVCATIISAHLLLALDRIVPFYDRLPGWTLRVLSWPLILTIRIALPIQKMLA